MIRHIGIEQFEQMYGHCASLSLEGHPYTSLAEAMVIARLMQVTGVRRVVEVGTAEGNTAAAVLSICPDISRWLGYDVQGPRVVDTPEQIGRLCEDPRYAVELRSPSAHDVEPCHTVFVDGGHSYEAVRADTIRALEAAQCMVIWHDYCGDEPGVDKLIEEAGQFLKIEHVIGTKLAYTVPH